MIRKVQSQDLSLIVNIEDQSFDVPWPFFVLRSYLGSEGFVLYEQDGLVMGYAIIGIFNDTAHLQSIAVLPRFRRFGVGTKLLNWCIKFGEMQNAHLIKLEVREKNSTVQVFYLNNGFRIKGRVSGYYVDDNAIVMEKKI
jgi:ribosomal-protein-alanine N-acetyltransferase